jgi:hypothetical protein
MAKRRTHLTWWASAWVVVGGLAAILSAAERGPARPAAERGPARPAAERGPAKPAAERGPAAGDSLGGAGLGFRVQADAGGVALGRTRDVLAHERALPGVYTGATDPVLTVAFGADAKPAAGKKSWVHQTLVYRTAAGETSVIFNRLSPAVLVDHPGGEIVLAAGRPPPAAGPAAAPIRYLAMVEGGKVVVRAAADLGEAGHPARPGGAPAATPAGPAVPGPAVRLDEPWILAWFAGDTVVGAHAGVFDVDSMAGVSKELLTSGAQDRVDVPVLVRLEHRPAAIKRRGGTIVLQFPAAAGKVAIMPLFGRRIWLPEETEAWKSGLPDEVTAQCRLWSRVLRDYPVTVTESFTVDAARDVLAVRQALEWASFEDDWKTPPVKAAPVPPMLAVALGGGVPVTFHVGGKEVAPADYHLMDSSGKAMGVEGADAYEYRIAGLGRYLWPERKAAAVAPAAGGGFPAARPLQEQLERHVAEMVQAGHLRPLFYVHGGIGSDWYANWYWLGTPETACALARAYPYLSAALQAKVKDYLAAEWKDYPPLRLSDANYKAGAAREPYDIPWDKIRIGVGRTRDEAYRQRNFFLDLYRIDACQAAIGGVPDMAALKGPAAKMAADLVSRMDWAILGPMRLRQVRMLQETRFMTLQGSAAYNSWLGGAIGLARLARSQGWREEEGQGWHLAGKLAMARIGQARYVAEMHRMGLVRGKAEEDYRAISHIDETCTIVRWGPITTVTMEDQEFPPFIDLVPEVGRLLAAHAQAECAAYLGYLDYAVPYWYLSEAPKQSATEHRTCPLWHQSGNVTAQAWVLGKKGEDFRRYVDATRFKGDLFYIQNLAAAIEACGK